MIIELVIIIFSLVYLTALCSDAGLGTVLWWVDAPTLICILILSVPMLFRRGMGKDFIRAIKMQFNYKKVRSYTLGEMRRSLDAVEFMQKQILYAGIITMVLPVMFVLAQITNIDKVGANLSVALISLLYTAILELLLLPLQLEAKHRIVNYMEEE